MLDSGRLVYVCQACVQSFCFWTQGGFRMPCLCMPGLQRATGTPSYTRALQRSGCSTWQARWQAGWQGKISRCPCWSGLIADNDRHLFAGQPQDALFVYNRTAACYWYNTKLQAGSAAQRLFYMAGWLAGQALHNRTTLGIRFAPLLWQKVLEGSAFQASQKCA